MIQQNHPRRGTGMLTILFLLMGLYSCQLPPQQGGNSGPSAPSTVERPEEVIEQIVETFQDASSELVELSRPDQVQAWVDQLIVKVQPGVDMPEVARMKEGDVATYLHQRTLAKTAFTLRGQRYQQPWILIKLPSGVMGWVHEGGVRYVTPTMSQWLDKALPATHARRAAPAAVAPTMDRRVIPGKQVGPIRLQTTEQDLIQLYGPADVGRSTVVAPGKGAQPCTVVLPGQHDELRITWKDDARTRIAAVYILRQGSTWSTQQGLRLGVELTELTKINQSPLSFYGLDWEYAGTVNSWKQGTLAPFARKFYVMLSPAQASRSVAGFTGDKVFSSNAPGVEALQLRVSQWVVYLD